MSRFLLGIILTAFIIALGIGCSTHNNPIENISDANPAIENSNGNHTITGVYNASFDPETMEFSVTPVRDASLTHFDFTPYLDMCEGGCVQFKVLAIREDGWLDIGAQMENPTALTVYDARLIFADPKGKNISDIDGFTVLWPSIGVFLKPFIAFAKAVPNREVGPYMAPMSIFSMQFVPGCKLDTLFIAECSMDENIEEPYDIVSLGLVEGTLAAGTLEPAKLGVIIRDWQDDVEWVQANLMNFTGEIADMEWNDETFMWECEIMNMFDLPIGEYTIPIETYSPNIWLVNAYGWATVEVTADPTAKQFVYTKSDGMGVTEVHSIYTDGTRDAELTSYAASTLATGVSADYSKIIYNSDYLLPGVQKGFIMDFDGSNDLCLIKPAAVSTNRDGSTVLLYDLMTMKMWIYDVRTYDLYQLPQEMVQECVMAADAPVIAYTGMGLEGAEIFTCNLYGENVMQMTNDGELVMSKTGLTISDTGMMAAYCGVDADPLAEDLEIYTLDLMMPDSQQNITDNDLSDTTPQFDGMGFTLVFVTEDLGAGNIMRWNIIDGVEAITIDSMDPEMVYANPDISSDGAFVVFEKIASLPFSIDVVAYDMTVPTPEPVQVTFDGLSSAPLVSAN